MGERKERRVEVVMVVEEEGKVEKEVDARNEHYLIQIISTRTSVIVFITKNIKPIQGKYCVI